MRLAHRAAWVVVCLLASMASATTYYVDASGGDDARDGQSQATAWKTIAKVNGSSFASGDQVLFKRGETWRESLVPPSSGMAGSPIKFDAYGSGEPPRLTTYLDLPASSWTQYSTTNLWYATVTTNSMNYVLFGGGIWGNKHTNSRFDCTAAYDFFFMSNQLYVYSVGNPVSYYGGLAAMLTSSGATLIDINNKSYVEVQHFKLNYFDYYGARIRGTSDHVTIANVQAEGIIPAGMLPHGFYVSASNPTDINLYNVDAHRNSDGFRVDAPATGVRLKNCRAYANRDRGLYDNSGVVNYSYCHFYANDIAIFDSLDVTGGVDGGDNVPPDTWPGVMGFARYPVRVSLTFDDIGFVDEDTYVDSVKPLFDARGIKMSLGVIAAYSSGLVEKIQGWFNAGHDINSHSWSHQYYTDSDAFTLTYGGTGTAARVTISGNHLTTAITGGPGGENLNLDLASSSYDNVSKVIATINSRGVYTANLCANSQGATHSITLADVSAHDITAAYTLQYQKDRLVPDEMSTSKAWLQANISGLSNVKVYVYPGGIEDTTTQGWAAGAGYEGGRGGMSMNLGVKEVYGMGVNIQDITSLGLEGDAGIHGQSSAQIDARIAALVFKSSVWGVPYGLFAHKLLTTTEVANVLDSLLAHGATIMTNAQLMDWLNGQPREVTQSAGTVYVSAAGGDADFRPTSLSPVLNQGTDLGAAYKYDLLGMDQSWMGPGWEIGAYAFVPNGMYLIVVR